jgi:putative oxidoreductase
MPLVALNIAGWIALALLSLVFVANALAVIDQRTAVRELAATGVAEPVARAAVIGGRAFQLLAVPALFFTLTRPYAALGLILFLIPATVTAHAFWKAAPDRRDMQLAGFLKNTAIIGGLLLAAALRSPP